MAKSNLASVNVLIVDDQELVRRVVSAVLGKIGVAGVVTADDGAVAIDGMLLHRPSQKPVLAPADEKLWIEISPLLSETPHQPPVVHDLARPAVISP